MRGIHWSLVNSPHKGQWRGVLKFSLICIWIYGWVNNREAGDLRRYIDHYDVTVWFGDLLTLFILILWLRNWLNFRKPKNPEGPYPLQCINVLWIVTENMKPFGVLLWIEQFSFYTFVVDKLPFSLYRYLTLIEIFTNITLAEFFENRNNIPID